VRPAHSLLIVVLGLAFSGWAGADGDWESYKSRFLQPEGRIVDTGRGGISHSEGQAFGMLLAVGNYDHIAFERLWRWTRNNLRIRNDGLFAWKWEPGKGVTDQNNASDGDLIIAWALWRAGSQWGDKNYIAEAHGIAAAIRSKLVKVTRHGTILLPGAVGFEHEGIATVNLSYWMFPALKAMVQVDPDPAWKGLIDSGLKLLQHARFGRWGLPPDWLQLTDPVQPSPDHPARFGYDAIRIPLYLVWGGFGTGDRLSPFNNYLAHFQGAKFVSPWTDLNNDNISSHAAAPGIHAVFTLAAQQQIPPFDASQDYYPASLHLLALWAQRDMK